MDSSSREVLQESVLYLYEDAWIPKASYRRATLLSFRRLIDLASRLPVVFKSRLQRQTEIATRFLRQRRQYLVHAAMQLLLFYGVHPNICLIHYYIIIRKLSYCSLWSLVILYHGHVLIFLLCRTILVPCVGVFW